MLHLSLIHNLGPVGKGRAAIDYITKPAFNKCGVIARVTLLTRNDNILIPMANTPDRGDKVLITQLGSFSVPTKGQSTHRGARGKSFYQPAFSNSLTDLVDRKVSLNYREWLQGCTID